MKKWWEQDKPTLTQRWIAILTAPGWKGDLIAVATWAIGTLVGYIALELLPPP